MKGKRVNLPYKNGLKDWYTRRERETPSLVFSLAQFPLLLLVSNDSSGGSSSSYLPLWNLIFPSSKLSLSLSRLPSPPSLSLSLRESTAKADQPFVVLKWRHTLAKIALMAAKCEGPARRRLRRNGDGAWVARREHANSRRLLVTKCSSWPPFQNGTLCSRRKCLDCRYTFPYKND